MQPWPALSATYVAFQILGIVLNDSTLVAAEHRPKSGTELAAMFYKRSFAVGNSNIYFDAVGERMEKYRVEDFATETSTFKVCLLKEILTEKIKRRLSD